MIVWDRAHDPVKGWAIAPQVFDVDDPIPDVYERLAMWRQYCNDEIARIKHEQTIASAERAAIKQVMTERAQERDQIAAALLQPPHPQR